ncbi:TIGR00730 family Rossman fold protein [Kineosporia babensis]
MARICVFCSSSVRIDPAFVELAAQVGTAIAARGHDLVSGGGSVSMMGAVAQAVRAGGRHTVGVIPQALVDLEVADHDSDELIVTPDMRTRKGRMDELADAFLTLPGGIGTLEELTEVWVAASLGMHAKPVVVLDPTGLYAPLHELIRKLSAENFLSESALETLAWTASVDEALDQIDARLGELPVVPAVIEQVESAP